MTEAALKYLCKMFRFTKLFLLKQERRYEKLVEILTRDQRKKKLKRKNLRKKKPPMFVTKKVRVA